MVADIETNITNNNSQPMKTQPLTLNAVLKVPSLESTTEGVYLNEDQVATIDTELANRETAVTNANKDKTDAIAAQQKAEQDLAAAQEKATNELAAVNQTLSEKETEIAELTAQVATLKGSAGKEPRRIVTEADGNASTTEGNMQEFFESIDNARELFNSLPE
jgi:predicted  nucleic acid-binding Zn-ribbon protein